MPRYDLDCLENRDPALIERLHRWLARPLRRYFRAEVRGLERVPAGPALLVGNHSSGVITPDLLVLGEALYRAHGLAGLPFGLAHEVAIRLPLIHPFIVACGAVRASPEHAHRLFARGDKVLVYPGATSRRCARSATAIASSSADVAATCGSRCASACRSSPS